MNHQSIIGQHCSPHIQNLRKSQVHAQTGFQRDRGVCKVQNLLGQRLISSKYFPKNIFLFLQFSSTATQFYESSPRCLPPLLRPQWPPLVQDLLRQRLISSKYSPQIFGSKYFPLLAIFSTQHKYTSYQLGVSDACEDLCWLNWCKAS